MLQLEIYIGIIEVVSFLGIVLFAIYINREYNHYINNFKNN